MPDDQNNQQNAPHLTEKQIAKLSYEQAIERLEDLIDRIESGDIGLEDSVKAYEQGIALKKHCEAIQNRAEQRVRELSDNDADPAETDTKRD